MNFSTASSSSLVVTPSRTFDATRRIVRAWTAPAAAIFSISAGVFLMITRRASDVGFELQRGDRRADVLVHLGGGLVPSMRCRRPRSS